jgi:hypothetical protein
MALDSKMVVELERELARIRNVNYAAVILDSQGDIEQIDILSDTQRPPRPIVRDVEAVLRHHSVVIDHRKIGVVQMNARPGTLGTSAASPQPMSVTPPPSQGLRLRLGAVHTTTSSGSFIAEVELILGAFEGLPGRAEGPCGDSSASVNLVARAAVEAVRNLLKPEYEIQLRATRLASLAGAPLVVVAVDFGSGRQVQRLAGTSWERGSPYEATVYACLDALNRSLGRAEFQDLMVQDEETSLEQLSWRAASA